MLCWAELLARGKTKTYKFNGMQGHLAMITMTNEYDGLRNEVGREGGWIGGTLMVFNDGNETKTNDANSL